MGGTIFNKGSLGGAWGTLHLCSFLYLWPPMLKSYPLLIEAHTARNHHEILLYFMVISGCGMSNQEGMTVQNRCPGTHILVHTEDNNSVRITRNAVQGGKMKKINTETINTCLKNQNT